MIDENAPSGDYKVDLHGYFEVSAVGIEYVEEMMKKIKCNM